MVTKSAVNMVGNPMAHGDNVTTEKDRASTPLEMPGIWVRLFSQPVAWGKNTEDGAQHIVLEECLWFSAASLASRSYRISKQALLDRKHYYCIVKHGAGILRAICSHIKHGQSANRGYNQARFLSDTQRGAGSFICSRYPGGLA